MRINEGVVDRGFRGLNLVHRAVVTLTHGRWGTRAMGMEVIELITVGRRSGRPHPTMLTVPVVDGDRLVLVASKGGDDRDPDWLANLRREPTVQVVRHGETAEWRARLATPEECDVLWPRVVAAYRAYDRYRRRASRDVPLVICEPATPA